MSPAFNSFSRSVAIALCLAYGLHTPVANAGDKVLEEVWEAAYVEGAKAGYVHTRFREKTAGDAKIIESFVEMKLTLSRFGQQLQIRFQITNHETPDGRVLGMTIRQGVGKDQEIVRTGRVEDEVLHLQTQIGRQTPTEKTFPWNEKALGLYGEHQFLRKQSLQPNTKLSYMRFEPELSALLNVHVNVKEREEVALPSGRQQLLRVEIRSDKVMNVEFPGETAWVDGDGEALKRESAIPGLGKLTTLRVPKRQALAQAGPAAVDVGISQLVKVHRYINKFNETREIVYQVELEGVDDPQTAFAVDDRQKVRALGESKIELTVNGLQQPDADQRGEEPPVEYLRDNHFIHSQDVKVQALARQAAGREDDPWKKALRIERWVARNLKNKNYTEAFATADKVARSLEGDCSEHAVLAAAMCRAVGVPSRTAVGFVHVPRQRAMGYHMWIEVWVNGRWYALDPTLGNGKVGAAHVKIADHHWNDVESFTPLLPVLRILGKVKMKIVSVEYARR